MSADEVRPELKHLLKHHDQSQLWFQLAEIVEDRTYLRHGITVEPGDVVIDAGANVGVAAAFFLAECGAGEVYSFEPVPEVHEMLVSNLAGFPGARTFAAGLSSRNGDAEFTYYRGAAAMSSQYADSQRDHDMVKSVLIGMGVSEQEAEARIEGDFEPVSVTCRLATLSSVIEAESIDRIDLLKIDVERAELDVLEGIDVAHWPRIRQVVAEVHDDGDRLVQIRSLLARHGFETVTDQEDNMKSTGVHVLYASRR